ncbi:MAG: ABC transporter substrate-binding protein [Bdellovibrionota bacterium]
MKLRAAILIFAILSTLTIASAHAATTITISCGAVGREFELCQQGAAEWAKQTGNRVEVLSAPNSSSERIAQYQLLLAAGSSDVDLFAIDTTWPGILSDFLLELHPPEGWTQTQFPSFVANNTVQGKLLALPWFIDAGVLFYRQDLLTKYSEPVPSTWEALTRTAKRIQEKERAAGNSRLWGFVFEARAYEGLTCNALEWFHAGGAQLLEPSTPDALTALKLASGWIDQISPRAVLNFMEEDAREVFQSGQAVFLRNWPYVWKLANAEGSPVRGKIGIAPVPGGAGTLGGWSLAVSRFSKAPREAVALATFLTSRTQQSRRLAAAGIYPAYPDLYAGAELARLREIFLHAVPRPSRITGNLYNRVSSEIWQSVHEALSGEVTPEASLHTLQSFLTRMRKIHPW